MLGSRVIEKHIAKLEEMCGSLPEVEIRSGQHYVFLVRGKKFAYYLIDHHGDGRVALELKGVRGVNAALVESDPKRFFLPPYMAHHGWIGLYVDVGRVNWGEIEDLLVDAYKLAAPKAFASRI